MKFFCFFLFTKRKLLLPLACPFPRCRISPCSGAVIGLNRGGIFQQGGRIDGGTDD